MKNIIVYIFLSVTLLLNAVHVTAQNTGGSKKQQKAINYSKYIGKTVAYFFSDFPLPIKDTIPIRSYTGIHSFILDIGDNYYLYITPQVVRDSVFLKRRIEDSFDLKVFYQYKIISILYKKNGETIKVYGKYNGRL